MVASSIVRDLPQSLCRTCTCRKKPGVESLTVIRFPRLEHPVDDMGELSRRCGRSPVLAPPLLQLRVEPREPRLWMDVPVDVHRLDEDPPQVCGRFLADATLSKKYSYFILLS